MFAGPLEADYACSPPAPSVRKSHPGLVPWGVSVAGVAGEPQMQSRWLS